MERNRIIIVGKGGSGKDYLAKMMVEDGKYKFYPSYTTRPPRENEVNGVDYHFVSDKEFNDMIDLGRMYEYNKFITSTGVRFYGRTIDQFEDSAEQKSVMILTPSGLSSLSDEDRKSSVVVYLDILDEIVEDRLMAREDSEDNWKRRAESDRKDFESFSDYDVLVMDPYFELDDVEDAIEFFLESNR